MLGWSDVSSLRKLRSEDQEVGASLGNTARPLGRGGGHCEHAVMEPALILACQRWLRANRCPVCCGLREAVAADPGMAPSSPCAVCPMPAYQGPVHTPPSLSQTIPPNFSLFDVVLEMRKQRPAAVQTEVCARPVFPFPRDTGRRLYFTIFPSQ